MQDILKVFLQASAAKGEWMAALQCFHSTPANQRFSVHSELLAEALARGGQWEPAVQLCHDLDAAKRHEGAVRVCAMALSEACKARTCSWQTGLKIANAAWLQASKCEGEASAEDLSSCCERYLMPRVPKDVARMYTTHWNQIKRHVKTYSRVQIPSSTPAASWTTSLAMNGFSFPATSSTTERSPEERLMSILKQPKRRHSWRDAMTLFVQEIPLPDVDSLGALLQCLSRQGRRVEAERVVMAYCVGSPPRIRSSRRMVQRIAECAHRLQAVGLSTAVLEHPSLASQLTPSSTLDLLRPFSSPQVARVQWRRVAQWWTEVLNTFDRNSSVPKSITPSQRSSYSLGSHLKLSSFVAKCIIQGSMGSEWVQAMDAFRCSENEQVEMALLFKLRLLRLARQWEGAIQLFSLHLERSHSTTGDADLWRDCYDIFFKNNAASWIPQQAASEVQKVWERSNAGKPYLKQKE